MVLNCIVHVISDILRCHIVHSHVTVYKGISRHWSAWSLALKIIFVWQTLTFCRLSCHFCVIVLVALRWVPTDYRFSFPGAQIEHWPRILLLILETSTNCIVSTREGWNGPLGWTVNLIGLIVIFAGSLREK